MKTKIFRVDLIEIENADGFRLKIQKAKGKKSKRSCLSIKSSKKKWTLNYEDEIKDRYYNKERTGIWYEREPDLQYIFTKVSLFEETKYSFKFDGVKPSINDLNFKEMKIRGFAYS